MSNFHNRSNEQLIAEIEFDQRGGSGRVQRDV